MRGSEGSAGLIKGAAITGAATDNTVVAAVSNKIIRVTSMFLLAATAVSVRFETGTGGTALTGVMSVGETGGFVLPHNPDGWFETTSGALLNMELSTTVQVSGALKYMEIEA